jgi:hypothetical protein
MCGINIFSISERQIEIIIKMTHFFDKSSEFDVDGKVLKK